jgi:transcription termination/antitermination protein NusG
VPQNTYLERETSGEIVTSGRVTPGDLLVPAEDDLAALGWYALSVRVRYEKLVARHLAYEGVKYFLPLYRSVRRWKDRRKELDLALFPGYVFVSLKVGDRSRVLRAPGVLQFVTFQSRPAAVPGSDIRALQSSFAAGLRPQPHPYLCQGHRVRVKRGVLAGTEGIMIRRKEGFRLVLSIDLIMRSVMLEVDEADVEPI